MQLNLFRRRVSATRDICAALTDAALCGVCLWAIFWFAHRAGSAMDYAGMPPRTLADARVFATDPFLAERLLAWTTALGCGLLVIVLCVSIIEGAWALLRRI